ncbi:hypothetical protein R8Z50_18340 [Longispora sp. K20-0274]
MVQRVGEVGGRAVGAPGSVPRCADPDPRALGRDCARAGRSATVGNLD